jgi:dTDP-4-amino-4,6-dideoxygalactose transaminase
MFYILLPDLNTRQSLIQALKERGILAVFHYLPLHLSCMGQMFDGEPGSCPVTEDISDRLLRLPFYYDLSEREQGEVMKTIFDFLP